MTIHVTMHVKAIIRKKKVLDTVHPQFIHQSIHSSTHPCVFIYPFIHPSSHSSPHPSTQASIHSSTHPSIHPFIHPLIHPWNFFQRPPWNFKYTSTHSFIQPSTHPSIHQIIHSSTHSSTHPSIHPFTHPPIHSFIHPVIHPSIHSSIHSFIHTLRYPSALCLFLRPRYTQTSIEPISSLDQGVRDTSKKRVDRGQAIPRLEIICKTSIRWLILSLPASLSVQLGWKFMPHTHQEENNDWT